MELEALQEVYPQILEMGASLVAVSPQLNNYTKQVVKKNGLTFPVLADGENGYAEKLGLTFTVPEKVKEVYEGFGIDLPRFNGDESWALPMSGRFIIDQSGIIRDVNVHPDHTIRPEPEEIVGILQSLK